VCGASLRRSLLGGDGVLVGKENVMMTRNDIHIGLMNKSSKDVITCILQYYGMEYFQFAYIHQEDASTSELLTPGFGSSLVTM
jgi:hypothetical protein